jgi:ABC-2 type transport system permease protein
MAVYKRTYKAYRGPLTPAWSRCMVLSRYGFSTLFESRWFTAYTVLCFLPFLVGLGLIYFMHSNAVQALFNVRTGAAVQINNNFFLRFLFAESQMGIFLASWAAPGMISKDFANQSIQLYLSRPLSRAEYLLGKFFVLAVVLSCTTWIPVLILFGLQAQMEGHGWLWQNLWMAGSIFVSGALWIAVMSLVALAVSVWARWRIAATALIFATFFVLAGFGFAVNVVLRTSWGWLLNLPHSIFIIWGDLFRVPLRHMQPRGEFLPLWSYWISVLAACALSVWVLNRKLKAREVVRG